MAANLYRKGRIWATLGVVCPLVRLRMVSGTHLPKFAGSLLNAERGSL